MTYAVSCLHGCCREHCEMLEQLAFSDSDTLYIIGDVVDRGPDDVPLLEDIMGRKNLRVLGTVCKKGGLTVLLWMTSAKTISRAV